MPVTRTEPSADPPLRFDAAGAESGYGAVLSATGQPVVVSDLAGRIVLWSRGAETAYGWSAADTLGRPLSDLLSPAVVQQYRQAAVTPAQDTWVGEAVLRRRDGTPVPVLVTSSPMLDQHGRAVGRVAVPVDLRAQQRAEQTAQELSAIVTSTADAVFTEDLDGTIRTWNRGAEDLYGYAAADVVGRHVSLLASEGAATETQSVLRAVAAGETVRALETVRRRRDGSRVDISLTASPIYDAAARVVGASIIGHDITDRRRLERELARLATHDALTGLPNRVLLVDRLSQALARSVRHSRPLAVLFVDLDRFRLVNADLGYVVGDAVLAEVAERLRDTVAPGDTVARFAGDAFVIVCEETAPAEAEDLAGELLAALARPTAVAEVTQRIAASIGIAGAAGPRPPAPDLLIRNAQAAMYTAKAESGGGSRTFDSAMRTRWTERVAVGADLRQVLADDALEIHFQPIVELASGSLVAVEALLRWPHPERGWIPPALFVPLAEEIGLIAELDDWAFGRACRDIGRMRADGTLPWDVQLAVNVSARDVGPDLVARVLRHADEAGLPLSSLQLEVTETALMADSRAAGHVLQTLRDAGVGVVLDDFGTGYSSLTYLRHLPLTSIKIDRAFVQHITTRPNDLAIAEAVVDLGHAIGVSTTAEGIETSEQLALLRAMGCSHGQGWLWSTALRPPELAELVRGNAGGLGMPQPAATGAADWRQPAPPTHDAHGRQRMLQLHGEGASLSTIAAALNAERYRTVNGQPWHSASVARVIADNTRPSRRLPSRESADQA